MSDTLFSILALIIAFFLITQLWIVFQLRVIVNRIHGGETTEREKSAMRSMYWPRPPEAIKNIQHVNLRVTTTAPGKFLMGDQSASVQIEDLSETGALVRGLESLAPTVGDLGTLEFSLGDDGVLNIPFRLVRPTNDPDSFGGAFEGLALSKKGALKKFISTQARKELEG